MEDEVKEVLFVNHLAMLQEAHEGKRCQDTQLESSTRGVETKMISAFSGHEIMIDEDDLILSS